MRPLFLAVLAASIATGVATGVWAQATAPLPSQAPVPTAMPFDIPYGASINLDQAQKVAAAAAAEAKKRNWKMAISVVDTHGELVFFERIDDTQLASIDVSRHKAETAVRYRRPTAAFYDQYETGHAYVGTLGPDLVASPGGRPLMEGGKIIGAIGVSGGAGVQDDVIAQAGAAIVK